MTGPAKNRLHDYEAGWLTLLIEMGVASRDEAQAAIDEMNANREQRRSAKRRKKRPE